MRACSGRGGGTVRAKSVRMRCTGTWAARSTCRVGAGALGCAVIRAKSAGKASRQLKLCGQPRRCAPRLGSLHVWLWTGGSRGCGARLGRTDRLKITLPENVTFLRRKASVPLSRDLRDGPTLTEAMAALGWLSYRMQAPLVHAMRPCFSSGAAHHDRRSCPHPNEQAPAPVRTSSMYRATRRGWGPSGQSPSWLLQAHSPGRS